MTLTGTRLELDLPKTLTAALPHINGVVDVTAFASQNRIVPSSGKKFQFQDYFFSGKVVYSMELISGKRFKARSGKGLIITEDTAGEKFVSGVKIISRNSLKSTALCMSLMGTKFLLQGKDIQHFFAKPTV